MLTINEILEDLLKHDIKPQELFLTNFKANVHQFCESFSIASSVFNQRRFRLEDINENLSRLWILSSLSNIYMSTKLLISCYSLPSGNLFRQFLEAIALSILCCSKKLSYAVKIEKNKMQYSYHKAIDYLKKKEVGKVLTLDSEGIKIIEQLYKYYNDYSHSSYISVGWSFSFDESMKHYIGPIYDQAKIEVYKQEIAFRIKGVEFIPSILDLIWKVIDYEKNDNGA